MWDMTGALMTYVYIRKSCLFSLESKQNWRSLSAKWRRLFDYHRGDIMHIASLVGLVVFYSAIVVGKAGAGNISDEIRLFLNRLYADGGNLDYGKSFRYRGLLLRY